MPDARIRMAALASTKAGALSMLSDGELLRARLDADRIIAVSDLLDEVLNWRVAHDYIIEVKAAREAVEYELRQRRVNETRLVLGAVREPVGERPALGGPVKGAALRILHLIIGGDVLVNLGGGEYGFVYDGAVYECVSGAVVSKLVDSGLITAAGASGAQATAAGFEYASRYPLVAV